MKPNWGDVIAGGLVGAAFVAIVVLLWASVIAEERCNSRGGVWKSSICLAPEALK